MEPAKPETNSVSSVIYPNQIPEEYSKEDGSVESVNQASDEESLFEESKVPESRVVTLPKSDNVGNDRELVTNRTEVPINNDGEDDYSDDFEAESVQTSMSHPSDILSDSSGHNVVVNLNNEGENDISSSINRSDSLEIEFRVDPLELEDIEDHNLGVVNGRVGNGNRTAGVAVPDWQNRPNDPSPRVEVDLSLEEIKDDDDTDLHSRVFSRLRSDYANEFDETNATSSSSLVPSSNNAVNLGGCVVSLEGTSNPRDEKRQPPKWKTLTPGFVRESSYEGGGELELDIQGELDRLYEDIKSSEEEIALSRLGSERNGRMSESLEPCNSTLTSATRMCNLITYRNNRYTNEAQNLSLVDNSQRASVELEPSDRWGNVRDVRQRSPRNTSLKWSPHDGIVDLGDPLDDDFENDPLNQSFGAPKHLSATSRSGASLSERLSEPDDLAMRINPSRSDPAPHDDSPRDEEHFFEEVKRDDAFVSASSSSLQSKTKTHKRNKKTDESPSSGRKIGGPKEDCWCCPICLDILDEAVETPCCSNLFCQKCIRRVNSCPVCKSRNFSGFKPNIPIRRMILELEVPCSNKGCDDVFLNQAKSKHNEVCPYALVVCPNSRKCKKILRKDFDKHTTEECPFRLVDCLLECGERVKLFELDAHLGLSCPNLEVTCPNDCGHQVKRGEIWNHKLNECGNQMIDCGLEDSESRCSIKLLRKNLDEHQKVCEFRRIPCKNDDCPVLVAYRSVSTHDDECPEKIVPCPNKCDLQCKRKELDDHLQNDCLLQFIDCPYASFGCTAASMQRKDYHKHLENTNLKHCEAMAKALQGKDEEINKLRQEMAYMKFRQEEQFELLIKEIKSLKTSNERASGAAVASSSPSTSSSSGRPLSAAPGNLAGMGVHNNSNRYRHLYPRTSNSSINNPHHHHSNHPRYNPRSLPLFSNDELLDIIMDRDHTFDRELST